MFDFSIRRLLLACLCFCGVAHSAPSYITFPSDIDWVTRRTAHFQAVFRRGEDRLAERTLRAAEKAYRLLTPIFPDVPDKTWVVLADFTDTLNGYSLDFPFPHIVIYASPPDAEGDLDSYDQWLDTVVLHEFVHTLHLLPASGYWRVARAIFGSAALPNGLMPTHFHEGLATFLETEKSEGGRGRGPQFHMYTRMAVEEKAWGRSFRPYDLFEGSPLAWPHGASPYYFGNLFYEELWSRKGAKGIHDLTHEYSGVWIPYLLNGPLEEVYGADYQTIWADIYRKKEQQSQKEIAEIKKHELSSLNYLTQSRYSKWDLDLSPNGRYVAYRRSEPTKGSGIEIRELNNSRLVDTIETGHSDGLCWGGAGKDEAILFSEAEVSDNHDNYITNRLLAYFPVTKKRLQVRRGEDLFSHVLKIGCSADLQHVLLYREVGGVGQVEEYRWGGVNDDRVRLIPVRAWRLPEGDWVTSLAYTDSSWFLLRHGDQTLLEHWLATSANPTFTYAVHGHAHSLRWLPATREWAFISNASGRDEIWRMSAVGRLHKTIALLGGANAFDVRGDTWAISSYRHGGYDVALAKPVAHPMIAETESVHKNDAAVTTEKVAVSATEEYSPIATLLPKTWLPNFLFVPDGAQISVLVPGFDVSQKHTYGLFGGWDTRGLPFADFSYGYRFARTGEVTIEPYYIPSYLGPGAFLQQWGTSLAVGAYPSFLPFRVSLAALFSRVEGLPAIGPAKQSVGLGVTLSRDIGFYRRPLSFAPSHGSSISLTFNRFFKQMGSDDNYFTTIFGIDQYIEAPWLHDHVFKLSGKLGYTEGTAFYASYFTGGGELLFSNGPGFFLNRGFQPLSFYGRRLANFNFEYQFPIAQIQRGYDLWPFFLHRIHGGLVMDATTFDRGTQFGNLPRLFNRFYLSAGAELKTDWTLFFYLPTRLRLGGYHGWGGAGGPGDPLGEQLYVTFAAEAAL